jgi:3-polyprenyl-4-hydroxybenzoate decarboxylase
VGAAIVPEILAGYHNPQLVEDLVDVVVARLLDRLDLACRPWKQWKMNEE